MGRREFLILQWWTLLGGSHETCEVVCSEAGDGCIEGGAFRHYSNSLVVGVPPDSNSGQPLRRPGTLSSPLLTSPLPVLFPFVRLRAARMAQFFTSVLHWLAG
jgi:hypothetical protein